jgi:hypothetical protein
MAKEFHEPRGVAGIVTILHESYHRLYDLPSC